MNPLGTGETNSDINPGKKIGQQPTSVRLQVNPIDKNLSPLDMVVFTIDPKLDEVSLSSSISEKTIEARKIFSNY